MADEDDLYADLYNEDIVGSASTGSTAQQPQQEYEKSDSGYADTKQSNNGASGPPRASFIPPAPASASAASGAASTSFIPPSSNASAAPRSTGSFIPPAPQQQQQQYQQQQVRPGGNMIDTAPATNTDDARRTGTMAMGTAAGSASMSSYQGNNDKPLQPHEMPDEGKLFVGGLNWDTTDAGLKQYFSQFGKVDHCLIMRDPTTGRSRGFAFLTFADPKAVNSVMVKEHYLDGKMIDPKRAIPRQENVRTAKCFVGGVPSSATADSFRAYFAQFGSVLDSTLMMDRETQKPRGYGFVTYDNDATVERLLQMGSLAMDGKLIEVKRATPRNNNDGARRPAGRDGMTGANATAISNTANSMGDAYGAGNNAMAGMMNNPMFGNAMSSTQFDPNALAQFFQQQGMGGAGGAFNPLMMQQMMMSGMGGWGAGAANPWMAMGGMNGMGGMGFGGMSGPMSLSPTLGQGQFRGPSLQQGAAAMTGQGAGGVNTTSMRNASTGSAGAGGMRASSSERENRHARSTSQSGNGALPNRPSGLPSRPGDASSSSHGGARSGSASDKHGRDYHRERSPERGSARNGSSNSRW